MSTTSDGLGWDWQQLTVEAKRIYPPFCHVCRLPIDLSLDGRRDPYAWTLDHLDARATHGKAVPHISRVRPAHRKCNGKRGKRALKPSPRSREW